MIETTNPGHAIERLAADTSSVADSIRVLTGVLAPTVAQGVIIRRPAMVALAERLRVDGRATAVLGAIRDRRGPAPVRIRIPGRRIAVLLDPEDVTHLLADSPTSFATTTPEKQAALRHFQPHGVLASRGEARERRRIFNELALQTQKPLHSAAPAIARRVREDTDTMLREAEKVGELSWERFAAGWWRIARGAVLGAAARDDHQLTDDLARLRRRANWAFAQRRDERSRKRFHAAVQRYLDDPEPGSVAESIARAHPTPDLDAADQVAHWLFAFDAAGIATFRTLALLAANPREEAWTREEFDTDPSQPRQFPRTRACVLEAVRLWPTTPMILRESLTDTTWHGDRYPSGTTFIAYTPLFHRDPSTLDFAHSFAPEVWLDGRARQHPELVPFSAGPGECPGRNLVLFTASTTLAALLREHHFDIRSGTSLTPPLPPSLDHFRIRLTCTRQRLATVTQGSRMEGAGGHHE